VGKLVHCWDRDERIVGCLHTDFCFDCPRDLEPGCYTGGWDYWIRDYWRNRELYESKEGDAYTGAGKCLRRKELIRRRGVLNRMDGIQRPRRRQSSSRSFCSAFQRHFICSIRIFGAIIRFDDETATQCTPSLCFSAHYMS